MVTIDEKTQSITISETGSWDRVFKYIYREIKNDVKEAIEDEYNHYDEEERQDIKKYLSYTPTAEDKVAMLNYLKDIYEWEEECVASSVDYSINLFDSDFVRRAVCEWIQEVFLFEAQPW